MDAYSISYTTPSRRGTSRIYQDLDACRTSNRNYTDERIQKLIMDGSQKSRVSDRSKTRRVGIVGAGIAGLRCADVLVHHGFEVTILEARSRLGGRMCQTKLPSGHLVDLGPNWIHGTEHNPILDLAKRANTLTHTWAESVNVFGEDGTNLEEGRSTHEVMWGIIVQAFKYSAENTASIEPSKSLYDFFAEKVHEIYPGGGESERKRKLVMQMAELWGAFVGSPVSTQSLKFFWLEECIDGENLFCAGTYQKILDLIAKPAKENADIKLECVVERVTANSDTVRLRVRNGEELEFDEVVMTNPLGWLKRNKEVFRPSLPARFSEAIDSIGYGSLEKIYITFSKAFWLTEGADPNEQFTGFTQWISPAYSSDTNPKRWTQEAVDLSTLPEPCSHPTMLFYIFGDQSVELAAQLNASPTEEEKKDLLVKFFEPYYSRLPNYKEDSEDCIPLSCLATSWVNDEFAGYGSYSTFRTGLKEGDKDVEIMREGLTGRSLWFAGEHTAPFVALGTVTGAYWSGEAVGERIAEAYGMKSRRSSIPSLEEISSNEGIKEVNVRGFADKGLEK